MKKIVLLACSILLLTQLFAQKTIAVKCGKLFDSKNGVMLSDQIILVKGNQIEQVIGNASIKDVKADSLIDLSGYTVLPGLIDCHVHALLQGDTTAEPYYTQLLRESVPFRTLRAAKSLQTSLLNGFTTVR
ncbi:MAG TPA: amidohydrolase, partial [Chitinophagaceae bacterium]|nr:amidohydrolase [Chitinophagaceae bacterium]